MVLEIKLTELFFSRSFNQLAQRISYTSIYGRNGSIPKVSSHSYSNESSKVKPDGAAPEEFRVLNLKQSKGRALTRRKPWVAQVMPARSNQMPVDQDWPSVWPGPRSFHPAVVPLPIRQGYVEKGAPPGKFANAELIKIPNFLHLTPPAIKKQCEALKRFCTAWPEGLETEEKCQKNFPVEVLSSDYCHSSPVIRNPLSRVVTIKVKLGNLPLDTHAKDKMLRLVGKRYNEESDEITIMSDRCPVKVQNYDYAMYVLTALYHEAWKLEEWEKEKSDADMEYYDWDRSASKKSFEEFILWPSHKGSKDVCRDEYNLEVSKLFNEGENQYGLTKYKEVTKKLFSLPSENIGT